MTNKVKGILAIVFLVAGFGALAYLGVCTMNLIFSAAYSPYIYGYYGTYVYGYYIAGIVVSAVMMIVFFSLYFRYKKFNKYLKKFHI
jgi:hypothetical protein